MSLIGKVIVAVVWPESRQARLDRKTEHEYEIRQQMLDEALAERRRAVAAEIERRKNGLAPRRVPSIDQQIRGPR